MRAIWTGEKLLSRTGKEIKGVPALVEFLKINYSDFPMDGELYNHGKTFQEAISSIRKTVNIEEDLSIQYHVYDIPVENRIFAERHELLKARLKETDRLKLVETFYISDQDNEILEVLPQLVEPEDLNRYEKDGYEGTMVRNANGSYKFGKRSSDLMKVKTFQDAEFPIVGTYQLVRHEKIVTDEWVPGAREKSNGQWSKDGEGTPDEMIGGLVLSLPDGRTFECGTGYDNELRRELWKNSPVGKQATIKFQELTDDGIPRFPSFKCVREEE
jgi:DNA ligase-1